MDKRFKKLYFKCFNTDGTIKLCGRNACNELINFCNKRTELDCGNSTSGKMRVEVIKDLAKKEGII